MTHVHTQRARPLASLTFSQLTYTPPSHSSLSPHVLADPTQHDTRSHALVRCSVQILSSGTLAVMETPATSWVVAVTVVVCSEGCFFFFK